MELSNVDDVKVFVVVDNKTEVIVETCVHDKNIVAEIPEVENTKVIELEGDVKVELHEILETGGFEENKVYKYVDGVIKITEFEKAPAVTSESVTD